MDRQREREELAFLRSGIVASVIANCHRGQNSEPYTAQDFMPSGMVKKNTEPTKEEMLASMRMINAMLGGEDLTNG